MKFAARCMEIRTLSRLLGLASLLVTLAGCGGVEQANPDVAVSISGEQIPYSDFEGFLTVQLTGGELDDAALSGLFDQFLEGQLLVRMAEERGLVEGPVDQRRAVAFLLRDLRYDPPESEMRAYFAANPEKFSRPEQVRLRLILVDDPGIAAEAEAALESEDFATVAARFSQGPTAHLGGDQGLLSREDLPARFADIIFALEVDEISGIVKADYGHQIFQVTERLPATTMTFEQAIPQIRRELLSRHVDDQLASLLDEARGRYNVRIFRSNLPFDYASPHEAQGRPDEAPDAS